MVVSTECAEINPHSTANHQSNATTVESSGYKNMKNVGSFNDVKPHSESHLRNGSHTERFKESTFHDVLTACSDCS